MKRVLLCLLIMVSLFMVVGCDNKSVETKSNVSSKLDGNVNKLYYKYLSSSSIQDTSNGKLIKNDNYNIIVSYQEGKSIEGIAKEKNMTYDTSKKINKVNWNVYDFKGNVISKIYMYERDNGTYVVTFSRDVDVDIDLDDEIKEFMDNVSFK